MCAYRHLVDRFLQPQADERGQGVVEDQQHDGIYKVVPLTLRMNNKLPGVGAVVLNDGGEAKNPADTREQAREDTARDRRVDEQVQSKLAKLVPKFGMRKIVLSIIYDVLLTEPLFS